MERLDLTPLENPEPEISYLFKHIVTHEVAYDSLTFGMREKLHEHLADYLEAAFPEAPPVDAIASHYARSSNRDKQREYFRRAGDAARKAYANQSALGYYGQLLELLEPGVERAQALLDRADVLDTVGRLDDALADFSAALALSEALPDAARAARARQGIGVMRGLKGDTAQAFEALERAQQAFEALGDAESHACALNDTALFLARTGDLGKAKVKFERAIAVAQSVGARRPVATALNYLGSIAHARGDYDEAQRAYEQSLALKKELGVRFNIANTLNNLGIVATDRGDYAGACALLEQSLELRRAMGKKSGIAESLSNLANVEHRRGELARSRQLIEESLVLLREMGENPTIAVALGGLGDVAIDQGDWGAAQAYLAESLRLQRSIGDAMGTVWTLVGCVRLAVATGEHHRAALLAGAVERQRAAIELALAPLVQQVYEQAQGVARAALGSEAWCAAQAQGAALTTEAAVELALQRSGD